MDTYYDTVQQSSDWTLFTCSSDVSFTFSQGVTTTGGSHANVLVIESVDGSKERIVLQLTNCVVEGSAFRTRLINGCKDVDEVKTTIAKNGDYSVYGWNASSLWLTGYMPDIDTYISYSSNASNCVFFIVESCNPIQSLVAA